MKKQISLITGILLASCLSVPAWSAPSESAVLVDVATAKAVQFQQQVSSVGTLVAEQGITVQSEIAGRVTKIYFKSGEYVKTGQPLVQIYPDILIAQLKANQAALELSQVNFKRYKNLFKKGAVSSSEFDTAAAQLKSDQAAVSKTEAQLEQTLIKAPFSGLLGIRQINLGDYASAGTSIVNLQDVDPIYVDFTVPEKFIKQVKVGDRVNVTATAYGQETFSGTVFAKDSLVNPVTRMLNVRASLPNPKHELVPGSFVSVQMNLGAPQALISIPQTAIVYSPSGNYVYRVVDNKAVKTLIETGELGDVDVLITKGLSAGDIVVTGGTIKLFDGAPVKIRVNQSEQTSTSKASQQQTKEQ